MTRKKPDANDQIRPDSLFAIYRNEGGGDGGFFVTHKDWHPGTSLMVCSESVDRSSGELIYLGRMFQGDRQWRQRIDSSTDELSFGWRFLRLSRLRESGAWRGAQAMPPQGVPQGPRAVGPSALVWKAVDNRSGR
jgi:hypothetical protein